MNQHTVKAYGDELNQLTAEVARMGGLAEAQVADAVDSVARRWPRTCAGPWRR